MKWAAAIVMAVITAAPLHAQVNGSVSAMVDVLPDPDEAPGRQPATELRVRVFAEHAREFGQHLRVNASAYLDGLE